MPRTKTQRKVRYRPVLKLPPLPPNQYEALRQNIAVHGVWCRYWSIPMGHFAGIIDGAAGSESL